MEKFAIHARRATLPRPGRHNSLHARARGKASAYRPLSPKPMKVLRHALAILAAGFLHAGAHAAAYVDRPEVQQFIREIGERDHFDVETLKLYFAKAAPSATVLQAILPPTNAHARSWQTYRKRFVETKRIAAGVRFWNAHAIALRKASAMYGVPQEIIVAIIGIETFYGRNMGRFNTFSALTTLAFDYPPRAVLFRRELEELLLLAREQKRSPLSYKGSFAGALGYAQFLPSSIRRYAVDFDDDKSIDLDDSAEDAIGSVANFLNKHGWVTNGPIVAPASIDEAAAQKLLALGIVPQLTPQQMREKGLRSAEQVPEQPAALIDLASPDMPTEYRLGYQNFYVLTRYNRSSFYGMAVHDLAAALKQARAATSKRRD